MWVRDGLTRLALISAKIHFFDRTFPSKLRPYENSAWWIFCSFSMWWTFDVTDFNVLNLLILNNRSFKFRCHEVSILYEKKKKNEGMIIPCYEFLIYWSGVVNFEVMKDFLPHFPHTWWRIDLVTFDSMTFRYPQSAKSITATGLYIGLKCTYMYCLKKVLFHLFIFNDNFQ